MAKAPTLQELRTRQCTPEELQAALLTVIERHNALAEEVRQVRATAAHTARLARQLQTYD